MYYGGRGKNHILDLGKDGCIIGGRKKNQISNLGNDVVLGEGKFGA
jgi:hypothetical protein